MTSLYDPDTNALQDTLFADIANDLRQQGYAVTANALPLIIATGLLHRIVTLSHDDFTPAGTGRQQQHHLNQFVRRDKIRWLTADDMREKDWLNYMSGLQQSMNRQLLLGLFSYECHFSHYQPGDFYKKHLDAFRGQSNRILSTVLYLNPDWENQDGGELVLFHPQQTDEIIIRVTPRFGTLVTFLSEDFPHEVLPARRDRYSIAGWFRLNGSIANQIDPPS